MNSVEAYLIAGAILLILSVISSKATGKLGIPSLLVFLFLGMLAGSEGIGGYHFDNVLIAQTLGVIALIFILFAGGLETRWESIRPVLLPGGLLATFGVFITCILTGLFAAKFLGLELLEGLLLGAIISSTDAAAVFTVFRAKSVSLKGKVKPLLELESGSNDPMAVFLTVGLLQLLTSPESSALALIPMFFQQMVVGAALGWVGGKGIAKLLNWIRLESEGLYPVMTIALVIFTYGLSQLLGGNGFLTVYLTGLFLGRENFIQKKSLILFHDGVAWLMQITMFITLGLLVFPTHLIPVIGSGLILSAVLIFLARPLGVFISLSFTSLSLQEKLMVSWVGLRGAVPIILATYPLVAQVKNAELIFNLVFFIVLTSVLLQGTSIPMLSKLLKINAPIRPKFRYPIEYVPTNDVGNNLEEIEVPPQSKAVGKTVIDLGLPKGVLIVLIQRNGQADVPRGSTQIEASDTLLVLAEKEALAEVEKIIQEERESEEL